MNVSFSIFSEPRQAVQSALQKPNLGFAAVLVALPSVIAFLGSLVFGFPVFPVDSVLAVIQAFIAWIVLSAVFFAATFLVKVKGLFKPSFQNIASSLSMIWLFASIITILGLLGMAFISPEARIVAEVISDEDLEPEAGVRLYSIIESKDSDALNRFANANLIASNNKAKLELAMNSLNGELANLLLIGLIALIAAVLFFVYAILFVPYFLVSELFRLGFAKNLGLWLVLLLLSSVAIFITGIPFALLA